MLMLGALAAAALAPAVAGIGRAHAALPSQRQAEPRQAAPDPDPDVTTLYRGTIGADRVQLAVAAKPDEIDSFAGHYFVFGGGRNIAVTGEIDGESFYMEESEDGTTVSATWDGKLVVDQGHAVVIGSWRNIDETVIRPFRLEPAVRARGLTQRSM